MYVKYKVFNETTKLLRGYHADAGIDIFIDKEITLKAGETKKVPLGFGVQIPYNFFGVLMSRTSIASMGVSVAGCPIDPGYTGEVTAIFTNNGPNTAKIPACTGCCQLVVQPFQFCTFIDDEDWDTAIGPRRKCGAFGSSDIKSE